jgi:hypothetical protein
MAQPGRGNLKFPNWPGGKGQSSGRRNDGAERTMGGVSKSTYRVARRFSARHAHKTMESHEVMKEVLKKTSAKQIAADMGLSLSLIYKWAELPEDDSGSGTGSPLDRVGQLIRITKDASVAQWVCEQAGGFYIRNPNNLPPNQPLIPLTNGIVQEFADMLATIAISSADSVITKDEAKKIRLRWEDLKTVTEGFVRAAEQGNYGGEPAPKK